ncbi:uncharacterized protein [Aphelocoma coerulescens]|uniref:uncharacterized protein n=1 Tax=Aphelocoma coerulescens TaxID=39617 RepID=UPI0036053272
MKADCKHRNTAEKKPHVPQLRAAFPTRSRDTKLPAGITALTSASQALPAVPVGEQDGCSHPPEQPGKYEWSGSSSSSERARPQSRLKGSEPPRLKGPEPPQLTGSEPPRLTGSEPPRLKGSEPPRLKGSEPPRLKGSEPPRLKGPEPPRLKGSEPPRLKGSEPPRLKGSEPPRLKGPEPPRLKGSEPPRLKGSEPPRLKGSEPPRPLPAAPSREEKPGKSRHVPQREGRAEDPQSHNPSAALAAVPPPSPQPRPGGRRRRVRSSCGSRGWDPPLSRYSPVWLSQTPPAQSRAVSLEPGRVPAAAASPRCRCRSRSSAPGPPRLRSRGQPGAVVPLRALRLQLPGARGEPTGSRRAAPARG